ncbi:glycine zipper 2TM domain-containing protein [Wielerella bovis]|uniref:glycine zipper 2TM domain-containing protein n=1 Tax=Wielerella bovis TaxID=2917790 RepID=UPI002018F715|nr:glycine zipper 2TM domain-containing protein [Wielerella bovis]MCG7656213.1 glycine zipper 2TM domain-containing protein [Wielerella bovis]MCG7658438.1 glycine zipper 2TM domain-containing protein [Wielerella bovis]ULJ60535.1 glycine zipper 2TM domain-containing protein [Wielerella bovis]ULJ62745.1 glycine zipper 2TM domain-containing protein [Wielerella bovis]ULJ64974.1 glycine zipper 2TM domain-containing protein [Wielerella bovis]
MKSIVSKTAAIILMTATLGACTANGGVGLSQSQANTALGAVVGAAAGNLIGHDTEATLTGAALGGLIGSQINR